MVYKAVGDKGKLPFGGPVLHLRGDKRPPDRPVQETPEDPLPGTPESWPGLWPVWPGCWI